MSSEKTEVPSGKSKSTLVQKALTKALEQPVTSKDSVLNAEKAEIAKQRNKRKMPGASDAPSVGLALSGGGIRSATFALGALQTLCRLKLPVTGKPICALIEFIDYLSTVSGGGYIGSWFVANRKREMEQKKKAGTAFAIEPSNSCEDCDQATEQVAHLRRYSHYLNPDPGIMSADTWTMVTIWLRNTLLIQAMVFCVVASCFMLPHLWLRAVNSLPGLIGTGFFKSYRWTEAAFPVAILICFIVAYRQAWKEIALFVKDKKVGKEGPDGVKAESINPIDQKRVQVRIVLPAVIAALLTTLWLWLHHVRLNTQSNPGKTLTNIFADGGGFGWLDSSMLRLQDTIVSQESTNPLKPANLHDWWTGMEPTTILISPWMLLLTLLVVFMAYRLMWLREDLEAQERRGGSIGEKISAWLIQHYRHFKDSGQPAPAGLSLLKTTWKPWCEQMRTDHEGFRRFLFFCSLVIGSLFSLYLIDEGFRSIFEKKMSFAQPEPAVHMAMGLPHGQLNAEYVPPGAPSKGFDIGAGLVATLGPAMMVLKYMLMLILALGLAGRRMFDNVREWWSRVCAWLMIYGLAMLALCGIVLFSPIVFDWIGDHWNGWVQGGVITGWVVTLVSTLLLGKGEKSSGSDEKKSPVLNLDNAALVVFLGLLFGAAWIVRFMLTPEGYSPQNSDPLLLHCFDNWQDIWLNFAKVLGGMLFVSAALVWRIDLNEFSMNHFYRNRLVRCYLGGATHLKGGRRPHPFTGFEFRDDQALAGFIAEGNHPGPYPLINTALNTSQGGDLDVQERKAESFLLSPLFCGSSRRRLTLSEKELSNVCEGFRPTPFYMSGITASVAERDADSEVTSEEAEAAKIPASGIKLGTALSISGAAASPNSGYHTSPVLAFLMTIFNVRLGWWVPNPAKPHWLKQAPDFGWSKRTENQGSKPKRKLWPELGFLEYLSFELFGSATPNSAFVYLSDGGHFENLGIYELVRRECRFIIAIDGEEDGEFTFHALGTAIRRCRVDFDSEIEISVDEIRPDPATGLSRSHCAVGVIKYANGTQGTLLYIKSSLTGDEATDIAQYKKMFPAFPHESTGDQFFSESQFESYRKLGQHAAREALAPLDRVAMKSGDSKDPTAELREELRQQWYRAAKAPKESFINHTAKLDEIWASLAEDDLPECISDIVLPREPGRTPLPMPTDTEERHQVICFGQRLIQLMENVCLDLQLSAKSNHPDHTGWIELFRAWVNHPVLNSIWNASKDTYGTRFAHFWEDLRQNIQLSVPTNTSAVITYQQMTQACRHNFVSKQPKSRVSKKLFGNFRPSRHSRI